MGRILPTLRADSYDPDEIARPKRPSRQDIIRRCAFAIYRRWSREIDPARAERRFENLPPCTRQAFEQDAVACLDEAAAAGWRP